MIKHTPAQREIMEIVFKAHDAGEELSFNDLRDRLSDGRTLTRQAITCRLGFLTKAGLIIRKRKGWDTVIQPTLLAYQLLRNQA